LKTQDSPADSFVLPESGSQSEAVRAAQERLMELRRSLGIEPCGRNTRYEIRDTNEERAPTSYLESRLAYFSEPLGIHLRAAAARRQRQQAADSREWLHEIRDTRYGIRDKNEEDGSPALLLPFLPSKITNYELRITNEEPTPNSSLVTRHSSLSTHHSSLIKVFPDIALGMLRAKAAAAGRVWLLLRHFDAAGRGRIAAGDAIRLLTGDGSPARICGRRQLDNLLRAGDGLFWERDTARDGEWLRLRSAARVAAGLGVTRLGGSPVAVPLSALTGTIGQARAHLYASFHSGRTRTDLLSGEKRPRGPISRTALCKLSGAATNSQRNYERRARVGRRAAIALGPLAGAADEHETAWERGRAMFRLRDVRGRYGRPGAVYLAWQLPNEYTGPHDTLPRGRQKRLNRTLADLFHDGMTGNGKGITNDELRMTNEEVVGGEGQRADSEGQGGSRSVGQWDSGTVNGGLWSVVRGPWSASSRPSAVSRRHSSLVTPKRFYATAKAAHGARHEGEKYWRYGAVWLWQPELRATSDELRVKRATAGVESKFLFHAAYHQPTTCNLPHVDQCSELDTRHS
jgi:hypothetical protein